ncbi:MAG: hypothetical protein EA358_03500 [Flavobacteriales bacterium]|nr:MAG: hypothetical protein EA358_03500 [Flavobacteriales bacterium]
MYKFVIAWIVIWLSWLWIPVLLPVAFVPFLWAMYDLSKRQIWVVAGFFGLLFLAMSWWILSQNPAVGFQWIAIYTTTYFFAFSIPFILSSRLGVQRSLFALPFFVVVGEGVLAMLGWNLLPLGSRFMLGGEGAAASSLASLLWIMVSNVFAYRIFVSYLKHNQIRPLVGQSVLWIVVVVFTPYYLVSKQLPACSSDDTDSKMVEMRWKNVQIPEVFIAKRARQYANERCVFVAYPKDIEGYELVYPGIISPVPLSGTSEQYNFSPVDFSHYKKEFSFRISGFVCVFMLLYFVSFTLRGARLKA